MRDTIRSALLVVLVAVVLAAGYVAGSFRAPSDTALAALYDEDTVTSVYESASPAVVQILLSPGGLRGPSSTGTGFLIDTEGHILTNNHVVEGADSVRIRFTSGHETEGQVLGTAPGQDLALVKVAASEVRDIAPLALADSAQVKPGQMAIVIGYPLGLGQTVTVGVVSGLDRSITPFQGPRLTGVIQTDASVNPGNSGGPLLDSRGRVVGVVSAAQLTAERTGGFGFAIPSATVLELLPRLKEGRTIERAWLGVSVRTVTPELAEGLGLQVREGVYVVETVPDGPAARAGIRGGGVTFQGTPRAGGDVILAIGGTPTPTVDDLVAYLGTRAPGDVVQVTVQRGGETRYLLVTLGRWPQGLVG